MKKSNQGLRFLFDPGFSFTSLHRNRNIDSDVLKSRPKSVRFASYIKPNIENSCFYAPVHNNNRHK